MIRGAYPRQNSLFGLRINKKKTENYLFEQWTDRNSDKKTSTFFGKKTEVNGNIMVKYAELLRGNVPREKFWQEIGSDARKNVYLNLFLGWLL